MLGAIVGSMVFWSTAVGCCSAELGSEVGWSSVSLMSVDGAGVGPSSMSSIWNTLRELYPPTCLESGRGGRREGLGDGGKINIFNTTKRPRELLIKDETYYKQ